MIPETFNTEVARGRWLYRKGEPMPARPEDDEDNTLKAALWYGYMLARAEVLTEQFRVKRILEDDNDPDDRPPGAMPIAA